MDAKELCCRCLIAGDVANQYEALCAKRRFTESDDAKLDHLSLMMTLKSIGFSSEEIGKYMELCLNHSIPDRKLYMLNQKRNALLDLVHKQEKQINQIDYLRYELQKERV